MHEEAKRWRRIGPEPVEDVARAPVTFYGDAMFLRVHVAEGTLDDGRTFQVSHNMDGGIIVEFDDAPSGEYYVCGIRGVLEAVLPVEDQRRYVRRVKRFTEMLKEGDG